MSVATAMALKLRCPATCKAVRRVSKCMSDFLQLISDMCKVQQVLDPDIKRKRGVELIAYNRTSKSYSLRTSSNRIRGIFNIGALDEFARLGQNACANTEL